MSKLISGVALKYTGGPIDYIVIFDWATGVNIANIKPVANGDWSYAYKKEMVCGITYVANNHKPLTHGPYFFEGISFVKSGYLALIAATKTDYDIYDVTKTNNPKWIENFSEVADIGLFNYKKGNGPTQFPYRTKIIDQFNIDWHLYVKSYLEEFVGNDLVCTLELLSESENVLFALKVGRLADYTIALWYGNSLNSLVRAPTGGATSYTVVDGTITFTPSSVIFTKSAISGSYLIESFTKQVDISSAEKVRVSTYANINGMYDQAFCILKVVS